MERVILVFLVVIGSALIVEAFLPTDVTGLLPDVLPVRVFAAAIFGLAIGLVSSVLGVAGGELIIPILIFAFGAGIKAAGTASLLVCLPTVAVGVLRHRRLGAYSERADVVRTVAPMGAGSVVGAAAGAPGRGRPCGGAQVAARDRPRRLGRPHLPRSASPRNPAGGLIR